MSIEKLSTALSELFGGRLRPDEPLSNHTTFRLGGVADLWLPVKNLTELVQVVNLARQHQVPFFILGGGANLLIGEAGIRGLVIGNQCEYIDFPAENVTEPGRTVQLMAESGVSLPGLVRRCAGRGLSGLEWAVGVPGTIGGAVVNNAGAFGSDMAHNLLRSELLTPDGERVWQPVQWFEYAYRTSRLKRQHRTGWVVLQAALQMTVMSEAEVEAKLNAFNAQRKATQPSGATIGSMFKNPPDDYAGRLIEAAGLKGFRVGQAQISPVHANFFQNLGGATAADVLTLVKTAQMTIERKFGIKLELEIEVVGEFPGTA